MVGLGLELKPAQLSACQYSLAWDCLIKLIEGPEGPEGPEGQRGRGAGYLPPPTTPCGPIDIPQIWPRTANSML